MNDLALKELLYKMADDLLIIGHRHSEWTGFGPLLEEDIAFSSMAQDKIGQSYVLYQLLNQLGEQAPDTIAFTRPAHEFKNSIFTELPNGEYDFSLIRHFLFDTAYAIRFDLLAVSAYTPLAELATKIKGELRYHTLHASTFIKQLGNATPESISRLDSALSVALPYAVGVFEQSPFEYELVKNNIFAGEELVQQRWKEQVEAVLSQTNLSIPQWAGIQPVYGGRAGNHSEYLQPLITEMSEVFRIDPLAEW